MESVKEQSAFTAFQRLFKERGLPQAIRSDEPCCWQRLERSSSLAKGLTPMTA